jgi:hypothetical protein
LSVTAPVMCNGRLRLLIASSHRYDGPVEPKMAAMLSRHVEHHLPFIDPGTFGDFAVFVNREHMLQTLYSMQAAQ